MMVLIILFRFSIYLLIGVIIGLFLKYITKYDMNWFVIFFWPFAITASFIGFLGYLYEKFLKEIKTIKRILKKRKSS